MRAAATFARVTLATVVAWSAWYFAARWWPAQCWEDGCVESDAAGHAGVRWAMWLTVVALGALAAALAASPRWFDASPRRVAMTTALAVACFAVVVLTLGDPFPSRRPPSYGE